MNTFFLWSGYVAWGLILALLLLLIKMWLCHVIRIISFTLYWLISSKILAKVVPGVKLDISIFFHGLLSIISDEFEDGLEPTKTVVGGGYWNSCFKWKLPVVPREQSSGD